MRCHPVHRTPQTINMYVFIEHLLFTLNMHKWIVARRMCVCVPTGAPYTHTLLDDRMAPSPATLIQPYLFV